MTSRLQGVIDAPRHSRGRSPPAETCSRCRAAHRHHGVGTDISVFQTGRRRELGIGADRVLVVFEEERGSAGRRPSGETARALARIMDRLPWPVDLQVRDKALALYTTARNIDLRSADEVAALVDATCRTASVLRPGGQ